MDFDNRTTNEEVVARSEISRHCLQLDGRKSATDVSEGFDSGFAEPLYTKTII